jgi:hypothetical protein
MNKNNASTFTKQKRTFLHYLAREMFSSLFILQFFCLLVICLSLDQSYYYKRSDTFGKVLVSEFGAAVGALVEIDYDVAPDDATKNFDSYMMVLITDSKQIDNWYGDLGNSDGVISSNIDELCNQPSMLRKVIFGEGKISFTVTYDIGNNQLSVVLLQCRAGNTNNPVSANIHVVMRNVRPNSEEYSHLGIEEVAYTRVLEGQLILYFLMLMGIGGQLYIGKYVFFYCT